MKFISIDIETTGLDPDICQILQIGAVYVDTNEKNTVLSPFNYYIKHDMIRGDLFALAMNHDILRIIGRDSDKANAKVVTSAMVVAEFCDWLAELGYTRDHEDSKYHIVLAGKNVASFDKLFLERLPFWNNNIKIHRRILDPALLYVDWEADEVLPNLQLCVDRAGMGEEVTHDALEDAIMVANLILKEAEK